MSRPSGTSGSIAAARSPTSSRARPKAASSRRKLLSENPGAYRRCRAGGASAAVPWRAVRCADPVGAHRRGQDGDDGRHQCAAGAQGRADAAGHHARVSRTSSRSATQARPDIFAKRIVKPEMLYARVVEAEERVRADGTVERPLDVARAGSRTAQRARRRHRRGGDRVHARLRASRARAAGGRAGARAWASRRCRRATRCRR